MTRICIAGATVYDPANGIDGQVRDLWIADGMIVEPPPDEDRGSYRIVDANGLVAMPGGVDMHCHIAGPKVNTGRKLRADERRDPSQVLERTRSTRSGTIGSVPSTFATAYKFAGLGYTAAFDAAVPPLGARQAHDELADTPSIDRGFYVLVGNNHYLMDHIARGETARAEAFLAWLINTTGAMAPKLVNPGGVEIWKQAGLGHSTGFDDRVPAFDVSPRQIVTAIATAANNLGLPHPVHIHANQLGMPGNWETTLTTMQALGDLRGHLTHIQYHSYGGGDGEEASLSSQVAPLVDYVNAHPNLSVDVGQVIFGNTTSMTGDGPLGYYLHQIYGQRWYSGDTECEAGCGVMPIEYRNRNLVHALQWAVGLEWYLLAKNPWQVAMSTDHPNGGSFLAYPEVIRLLMDRDYRDEVLASCPPGVRERTNLSDLDREYTLGEIAVITRAAPAKLLGLTSKGHLGPGADADVTLYTPSVNQAEMFQLPRMVFKSGELLAEEGHIRSATVGQTLRVAPEYDRGALDNLSQWFAKNYTIELANFGMNSEELAGLATVDSLA